MFSQNARMNMVKQQLRTGNVLNDTVLALYEELPREQFVPPLMQPFAYSDTQISLAHGQRMMTPLEEGLILQALNLQGTETVLEVGTGTGYLTALLSRLAKKVISIDYFEAFTREAQQRLNLFQCDNVELVTGDACQGLLARAPYDVVVMTGSIEKVTETIQLQLLPGGKLITIEGTEPVMHCQLHSLDHHGLWKTSLLFETNIPSLITHHKQKKFVF